MQDYYDDYPPCKETYCVLRIISKTISPDYISNMLEIDPTEKHEIGEIIKNKITHESNKWMLDSKRTKSKDCRRHIDWVIDQVKTKKQEVIELQAQGARVVLLCAWESELGIGGPAISPKQMTRLADFNIDLVFEINHNKSLQSDR